MMQIKETLLIPLSKREHFSTFHYDRKTTPLYPGHFCLRYRGNSIAFISILFDELFLITVSHAVSRIYIVYLAPLLNFNISSFVNKQKICNAANCLKYRIQFETPIKLRKVMLLTPSIWSEHKLAKDIYRTPTSTLCL